MEKTRHLNWITSHSLQQAVILSAVPVLVVSFLTGCLFATCGLMGSKANSECCACCYCCCNACYCSLVTMGKAFVFYWQVWLGWFGKTTCWLWWYVCVESCIHVRGFSCHNYPNFPYWWNDLHSPWFLSPRLEWLENPMDSHVCIEAAKYLSTRACKVYTMPYIRYHLSSGNLT